MKREPPILDDVIADPLVLGVLYGDRAAWFQLTLLIEDWVSARVPRHFRMRKARLDKSEDDLRDVLVDVLDRIDRDDFRALREYSARKQSALPDVRAASDGATRPTSFVSFLQGLVEFAVRDHVRKRYGRAPRGSTEPVAPHLSKRDLHSWAVRPTLMRSGVFGDARPAMTQTLTANAILKFAGETFDERELSVFRRYLDQASFEELADEFDLDGPLAARAEIRRLKERLRAHFRA